VLEAICAISIRSQPFPAALDAPLLVTGIHDGGLPELVIGHRAFDAEESVVVIGNDQAERFGW
jgi:hypothetical protein